MGCNCFTTNVTSLPLNGEKLTCGDLDLTPCSKEQELIIKYLLEAYKRLPKVQYRVWNRINVDDRWGDIQNKSYLPPIYLNSEFQWDKHVKEHRNGAWIRTSKIEMKFLNAQVNLFNLIPKEGDIVFVVDRWLVVLAVNKAELLPGTSTKWLKYELIVDTKQTVE